MKLRIITRGEEVDARRCAWLLAKDTAQPMPALLHGSEQQ